MRFYQLTIIILLIFSSHIVQAQADSLRAVVFDFLVEIEEKTEGDNKKLSKHLNDLLSAGLDTYFKILNRADIAKMLRDRENAINMKPMFDKKTAIENGKWLEARYSIIGKLFKFNDDIYVSVNLVDNGTTVQIGVASKIEDLANNDLSIIMKDVAKSLIYKFNNRNSGKYSAVILENNFKRSIILDDEIIDPSKEPIKTYIKSGTDLRISSAAGISAPISTDDIYVNRNTENRIKIYDKNGEVKLSIRKNKIFISTDLVTVLNVKDSWMAELGYYYHMKDGLYLGGSITGVNIPYDLSYTTLPNAPIRNVSQNSQNFSLNIIARYDYYIKQIIGKTVYGELSGGASFRERHPRFQLKGGIELNKWLSIEGGYLVERYSQRKAIFNPHGYATYEYIPKWKNRPLLSLKFAYQF